MDADMLALDPGGGQRDIKIGLPTVLVRFCCASGSYLLRLEGQVRAAVSFSHHGGIAVEVRRMTSWSRRSK